eukprot:2141683-Prymnesium_polylepis.1
MPYTCRRTRHTPRGPNEQCREPRGVARTQDARAPRGDGQPSGRHRLREAAHAVAQAQLVLRGDVPRVVRNP